MPKTNAGTRKIPILQEVFDAFISEYQIQKCLGFCEEEIDGYFGFYKDRQKEACAPFLQSAGNIQIILSLVYDRIDDHFFFLLH